MRPLNEFFIGYSNNISAIGNENSEPQANGRYNNAEKIFIGENSACQNQVKENDIDDKLKVWLKMLL